MKDILKMTSKQRRDYLSSLNVDEELVKANDFRIRADNECLYPIKRLTGLVNSSYKLFFFLVTIEHQETLKKNLII